MDTKPTETAVNKKKNNMELTAENINMLTAVNKPENKKVLNIAMVILATTQEVKQRINTINGNLA